MCRELSPPDRRLVPGSAGIDGKEMRHYVNGVREMSTPLQFTLLRQGKTSLGVRLNQVYWYKGALRQVRFSPRVLNPHHFLHP